MGVFAVVFIMIMEAGHADGDEGEGGEKGEGEDGEAEGVGVGVGGEDDGVDEIRHRHGESLS